MIVIFMVYETVCSTARSTVAAAGLPYVPHNLPQYEALIDRNDHTAYLLVVATATGAVMVVPDPFVLKLAESHDDLTITIDIFISDKK